MSDTSDDKGKDSQAEQTSKPDPLQSTDSETQPSSQAFEEKQKGNEAYKKKDFKTAHLHYDKAIELDPTEITFRNNKAAVYFEQKDYDKCIEVLEEAITIGRENRADYTLIAKALIRAGKAYLKKEDDDNALRYLHKSLSEHRTTETQKLCDEAFEEKQKGNEAYKKKDFKTAHLHYDKAIELDPTAITFRNNKAAVYFEQKDYDKCIEVLEEAITIGRENRADYTLIAKALTRAGKAYLKKEDDDNALRYLHKSLSEHRNTETQKLCDEAFEEKQKGNEAYKKKDFTTAHLHYDKAIELDPTEITFRNNKAAVYFEQKDYDKCIEVLEETITIGRENRADYTLIAKALTRAGKAYLKKEDDDNALRYLHKSLSEHRTTETQKLCDEVDQRMKEKERPTYTSGNEHFKKGDYPTAKKHYDEAIKRNSDDAELFSNRAACYTKLMEFNLALTDADRCIELDPIKGYLRKGSIYFAMNKPVEAAKTYSKVLELDPNCEEANLGYRDSRIAEGNDPQAVQRRAMADPDVTQILKDPAMQKILQQMERDPEAVGDHLKNPEVAAKIEKLMECGIIALR